MTGTGQPVVWICVHDLGLSGVPVVLLRYLQALPDSARRSLHVLAGRGGALEPVISRLCSDLVIMEPGEHRSVPGALSLGLEQAGAHVLGRAVRRLRTSHVLRHWPRPDVVVIHGAGGWSLRPAVPGSTPYLVHLHELETGFARCIPVVDQGPALRGARAVLAVSGPVAEMARARGVATGRVHEVPGVIDSNVSDSAARPPRREPTEARWVMGAGNTGWRKGTDRLAALAHRWASTRPDLQVGWVGGRPSGPDATAVGAPDPVAWFEERSDPWRVLGRADVIVVPSREDPLPLVALEAGARGMPVVAMPSGGVIELLADGRGEVGKSHDLAWMLRAVESMLDEPDRAAEMGDRLRRHVIDNHVADTVVPQWWSHIVEAAGS